MGKYDCNFCNMGKERRMLAYKITSDLSKYELRQIIRHNLIQKALKIKINVGSR